MPRQRIFCKNNWVGVARQSIGIFIFMARKDDAERTFFYNFFEWKCLKKCAIVKKNALTSILLAYSTKVTIMLSMEVHILMDLMAKKKTTNLA